MSDRQVVALAVVTALGAFVARGNLVLMGIAVGAAAAAWLARRPILLIVAVGALASSLGARATAGLAPPAPRAVVGEWATLLTDPAPNDFGSIGADVRIGDRHAQAFARGSAGSVLAGRLAGERVRVDGQLTPVTGRTRTWLASKHIAARLTIETVTDTATANALGATANAYRRVVARGAEALPDRLRPLFGGMVLGDDRGQSAELKDAFRAAGLTHLLVVSGQNVAFALLLAAPLLRRGRLWWRFALTVTVLVAFGTLTRWEPSVLRAEAMAAVAAAGVLAGRPVPVVRLLALAVTACVLVDPFLVRSVGFRLSVAACAGLALLTPPLMRRGVPSLVAASVAAQVGAAVVLVPTFGTVPLASLLANVLAVPVAGPIMMWGLTLGPVAGLVPPLAPVLHFPTRLALSWEAGVATRVAALPVAPLGFGAAGALAVSALGYLLVRRTRLRVPAFGAGVVTLAAVFLLALRGPSTATALNLGSGARLWVVEGRSVLVVSGRVPSAVLDGLRARRVHRLDVLVVTRPGSAAAHGARPLVAAFRPRVTLGPEHHQLGGARTARAGAAVTVGGMRVRVIEAGPPLRIAVDRGVYGQSP